MVDQLKYTVGVTHRSPDACAAWQLLVRFSFRQRASLPTLAAELDLSPAQCQVLHVISPDRPIPMRELANTLSCDASNVTGLVDRLELRGLVQRKPSTEDRRVKVLGLTPAGCRVRTALHSRMTAPPKTLARLSPDEQRALARLLERLME